MKDYIMIELKNNDKYIIIDMLNLENRKYFLLTKVMLYGTDIDEEFEICIFDEVNNCFEQLEDEIEYIYIKNIFEGRLKQYRKELEKIDVNKMQDLIKLKVIDINGYNYILEKNNGEIINLDIEIFGNFKILINDYIYMKEGTSKENIAIRFGSVYTDRTEIIKIIRDDEIFYLQRYYG